MQQIGSIKKITGYFKDFHTGYFNTRMYLTIAIFITILTSFNYILNFEDAYIDLFNGTFRHFLFLFLYHAFAYYGVLFIIKRFQKEKLNLSKRFFLLSGLGFVILALDRSFLPYINKTFLNPLEMGVYYRFCTKIVIFYGSMFTILLPLTLLKFIFDKEEHYGIYGLRLKEVNFKAYVWMLLVMAPFVFAVSFLPDFLDYYPVYKRSGGAHLAAYLNTPEWHIKVAFEYFYVHVFLNTELLFRGFMVIGLSKMIGKNAILPMAATYAVLHYGKPLGETISSVFGGYILGIVALYSRNIWGGVFVHVGIALLMEIFAFTQLGL